MRAFSLVVGLLLVSGTAHSETDVFMRAVGFALTGSDDAEPKAIDRANCVFAYKNDVFHLNNIHVDRIKMESWQNKPGDHGINVDLHGDDVVVEHRTEPGDIVESHKEYELKLTTRELGRVRRAWQYIYSHGCIGKKSPF